MVGHLLSHFLFARQQPMDKNFLVEDDSITQMNSMVPHWEKEPGIQRCGMEKTGIHKISIVIEKPQCSKNII